MKKLCPKCENLLIVDAVGPHNPVLGRCVTCDWIGPINAALIEPKVPIAPRTPYVSIDIETTGLDPETCQTLEVGAVIDDWKRPINELPRFRRILIYKMIHGNPYALALNAGLLKQLAAAATHSCPVECADEFCQPDNFCTQFAWWLQAKGINPKAIPAAGKNFASFDLQFLKQLPHFQEHLKFNHRVLDPAVLYWKLEDNWLPDSKTCYQRAGIDDKVAHNAIDDALAVVRLVRLGITRLKDTP